jgi:hypothetical protein
LNYGRTLVGYAEAAGYQSIGDDITNSTIILFLENSHKPAIGRGEGTLSK